MVNGFYIDISNGLLKKDGKDQSHRKRMGEAVWEFMWCIDHITLIDKEGLGWVLRGKPVNLQEIADDMNVHFNTVSRNLNRLKDEGYIVLIRTPYGIKIGVYKAKKRFKKHGGNAVDKSAKNGGKGWGQPNRESPYTVGRITTNGESNIRQCSTSDSFASNKNLKKLKNMKEQNPIGSKAKPAA